MSLDQREILRRVERIAAIRPSPAATQRAVAEALNAAAHRPRASFWKQQWWIPAGAVVAACLLVAIGLGVRAKLQPATPQGLMARVLQSSETYRGWIQITPAAPLNVTLASAEPAVKSPVLFVRSAYVNPAEYAEAVVGEVGGSKYIALQREDTREVYDGRTDTLYVTRAAAGLFPPGLQGPLPFKRLLAQTREALTLDPAALRHHQEGGKDRFYMPLPDVAPPDTSKSSGLPIHGPVPEGQIVDASTARPALTLWASARSGTIDRLTFTRAGQETTATVAYGQRITSIYDLGAPRTAKTVTQK